MFEKIVKSYLTIKAVINGLLEILSILYIWMLPIGLWSGHIKYENYHIPMLILALMIFINEKINELKQT